MSNPEKLRSALINAHKAGDVEAARKLANAIKLQMGGFEGVEPEAVNARIEQAHSDASVQPEIVKGAILPFARVGDDVRFDMNQGIPGALQRMARTPGDAFTGKLRVFGPDGHVTDAAISRALELASGVGGGMAARTAIKAAPNATRQLASQNIDDAAEFGVTLSRGQAGRKFADQAFEEDALTGGRGNAAQLALKQQRDTQADQVRAAAERMQDDVFPAPDGDLPSIQTPQDRIYGAAENIGRAVADEAAQLKSRSQAAYRQAEAIGGEISPQATNTLSARMRGVLDEQGAMDGVTIVDGLPQIKNIMRQIDDLSSMKNAPDGRVVGVDYRAFERIRSRLVNMGRGGDNQSRIAQAMKRNLDDWFTDAVDSELVSGSPEFLANLKEARAAWGRYQRINKNPQQIIRKMSSDGASSVEIANWLYGANKVGGRTQSVAVVKEIKSLIGEAHPAVRDLQRNVMTRLFSDARQGDIKTYGRLAGDINDFVNNQGRDLARELYTKEQIDALRRFAGVVRNLTPDALSTNPSRSGQTIGRRFAEATERFAALFGLAVGDIPGMLAGFATGKAVSMRSGARARAFAQSPALPSANRGAQVSMNAIARLLAVQAQLPDRAASQSGMLPMQPGLQTY